MKYQVHSITSQGKYHQRNEDAFFISDDFIIVADGMGGERDGDIASKLAVDTIAGILMEGAFKKTDELQIKYLLQEAIDCADSKIIEYIDRNPDSFGMGTTILVTMRHDNSLFISWCGDSRCLSYKKGHLVSLTKDHSYVQGLVDAGVITVKESYTHPDNNLITRYVGGGKGTCMTDFKFHPLSESEIIILCSDGLSGYCQLKDIEKVISGNKDISQLPEQLKNLAVSHGSDDDITIVVLSPQTCSSGYYVDSISGWFKKVLHL